jgi:hypothetical protein
MSQPQECGEPIIGVICCSVIGTLSNQTSVILNAPLLPVPTVLKAQKTNTNSLQGINQSFILRLSIDKLISIVF